MKCPICQLDNEEGVRFCGHCGSRLGTTCAQCGFMNFPGSCYCIKCGSRVNGFQEDGNGKSIAESERKHVTVLFSDLSGYTHLTEQLDPEQVKILMNRVFQKTSMIIEKYDGFIERYIGDCIMAVFGIPRTHEDDPVRAIRTAMEIHEAVKSLTRWVEDRIGRNLTMHTGIDTGLVVTARVDREKGVHGLAGLTVNVAARLEGLSRPDEIIVGRNTFLQAEREFQFEEMEPVNVKGCTEALRVYKLVGPKEGDKPPGPGLHTGLIDRENELSLLIDRVEQLVEGGRGGILWITGEAGIGKSRLLAEVMHTFAGRRLLWLTGRALSYGQTISYWPFLDILKGFAGITERDDEIQGWEKLHAKINRLFPDEVADTLPYLATLLTLEVKGSLTSRVQFLDGESMRRQIFRTSRHFLSRLSREQPLFLEFEDFHWADRSTLDLLEHLLHLVVHDPVVFCFVSRSETPSPAEHLKASVAREYSPYYTAVNLLPLDSEQSEGLVCRLLHIETLSSQMRDIIRIKSQGNPLFLEELIRALIDAGVVSRDKAGGKWRIKPVKGKVPIPDTLRTLIAASVDRLDEDIKDVLRAASVIGRSFLYRLLREIVASCETLEGDLSALEKKNLIREKCREPLEYMFKHDLIKESLYESILLEQRERIHRRVGEAMERLFQHHLEPFYGLLAYHYAQASDWGKAHEYLLKTGDQAGRMAADTEALSHYKKAVAAYDRMFGRQWDPRQRAALERKIGEALFRRGEYRHALESVKKALELVGDPIPVSARKLRRGIARHAVIQLTHRAVPSVFVRAKPVDDPAFEEWAALRKMLGWIDYCNNNERLLYNILSALNRVERRGDVHALPQCYSGLGMSMDALGRAWIARKYHGYALRSLARAGNPLSEFQTYYGYGMYLHFSGRKDEAIAMYDQAAGVGEETGDVKQWASAGMLKAILLNQMGSFQESLALIQAVADAGREVSDDHITGWGLAGQGKNLLYLNEIDRAEALISEAAEILRKVPDLFVMVSAMNDQAFAAMLKGDLRRALELLNKTRRLIKKQSLMGHCVWEVHYTYAELCLRLDLKPPMETIRKISKSHRAYQPRYLRLKGSQADKGRKRKRALSWWQASIRESRALENRLEEGLTYLEMGKALSEDRCIEQCRDIFSELDARTYLAEAKACATRVDSGQPLSVEHE